MSDAHGRNTAMYTEASSTGSTRGSRGGGSGVRQRRMQGLSGFLLFIAVLLAGRFSVTEYSSSSWLPTF